MNKNIFALAALLMAFTVLFSSYSYAGSLGSSGTFNGFDVSIDRVRVNGKVVSESQTNLIPSADVFSVVVDFTNLGKLEKAHAEAVLSGSQSGNSVSDSTNIFDLANNQSSTSALTLILIDSLKREKEFNLAIKIIDAKGNSEEKTFRLKTQPTKLRGALDVSIDRV